MRSEPRHTDYRHSSSRPSSPLVAFLRSMGPLDPAIAAEMEHAIEEHFERVDDRD
jgi:hypothetical protein